MTAHRIIAKTALLFTALSLTIGILGGCSKKSENFIIEELSELDSRPIGYLIGSSFLDEIEDIFPNSTVLGFESFAELISALKSGRIDAYFVDESVGSQQIKEASGIKLIGEPLINESYGSIFNKEKAALRDEFNSVIQKLTADGTVDFLIEKWIRGDGAANLTIDESRPCPLYQIFISLLLILVGAVFIYTPGDIAATLLPCFLCYRCLRNTFRLSFLTDIYYIKNNEE